MIQFDFTVVSLLLKQINKYAFSGGQVTVEEHREKGGDCSVDTSYQYLKHFLESDEELIKIEKVRNIKIIKKVLNIFYHG